MVILITGASHTGKTLLAQRLLEKYKYPYLSIDHLKMGLIRSGNTDLTPEDDDELTGYLWPIVREMIKTAVENGQNLIVEGCYVPFSWRRDFEEPYLKSVRFVCLAMTDGYIDGHFREIVERESEIESRLISSDCTRESLKADNERYIDGFISAGERVELIEDDFEASLDHVLDTILDAGEDERYFRVISDMIRFGCGYRTVDGKRQYFAWHGYPNRDSDFFTTAEISEGEYCAIGRDYPVSISADRETAEVFRKKYVDGHPVLLEGWDRLL